ncbi:MAG: aminopeptidase P family protein [Alphaproteobacteria bacterium]
MDTKEKLAALRAQIKRNKLQGYLQPVHDEFMSEYPPASAQRVRWLSGFSGSAGTLVVLENKAALFTDGRYTLQAAQETDTTLFEQHNITEIMPEAWLAKTCSKGARIGYDARLYTKSMVTRIEKMLHTKDITFVTCDNLVDAIWKERPAAPASKLFVHDLKYAGVESPEKRQKIAELLQENAAEVLLLTAPDSVCWLLNIRASDVEHTPLALGNALLDKEGRVQLFIHPSRVDDELRVQLGNEVSLHEPAVLKDALNKLASGKKAVWCDTQQVSMWHMKALHGAHIIEATDPCQKMKACKNPVELKGIENAHVRDGAAVVKLLAWLDKETQMRAVKESEVCDKLKAFRAEHPMFHDLSFPTISGSGAHGAIVHYRVTQESDRALQKGELFLLDSGAQYPDGTTDITRTVPIGTPSTEQVDRFTRVLKGHIAIATARFPKGTTGSQLDAFARQHLWQAGLDYDHGTGHGVGCFLGVHEGPQRISKRGGDVALEPGMIVSNEPGYYKTGAYGIRIENLVVVSETKKGEDDKAYYGFDTLTCVPIDTRLVDAKLLTNEEKDWLNQYHTWVLKSLSSLEDSETLAWLRTRCVGM